MDVGTLLLAVGISVALVGIVPVSVETYRFFADPALAQVKSVICEPAGEGERTLCVVSLFTRKPEALKRMTEFQIPGVDPSD